MNGRPESRIENNKIRKIPATTISIGRGFHQMHGTQRALKAIRRNRGPNPRIALRLGGVSPQGRKTKNGKKGQERTHGTFRRNSMKYGGLRKTVKVSANEIRGKSLNSVENHMPQPERRFWIFRDHSLGYRKQIKSSRRRPQTGRQQG